MMTQFEKGLLFKSLHESSGTFLLPNAWDAGTAKIISSFGFSALGSSSAAIALSHGLADHALRFAKTIQVHRQIVKASTIPVTADFGFGYSDDPDTVYKHVLLLAKTGIAGLSIEDVSKNKPNSIEISIEKVKAVCAAAKELDFPFTITARADNYFVGINDLHDTIDRLQAFQQAGADVLFAPGIKSREEIKTLLSSIDKPLNVLAGIPGFALTFDELAELGVKRISIGAAIAKQVYSTVIESIESLKKNELNGLNSKMNFREIMSTMQSNEIK